MADPTVRIGKRRERLMRLGQKFLALYREHGTHDARREACCVEIVTRTERFAQGIGLLPTPAETKGTTPRED